MAGEIVLKRRDAERMLKDDRRRVVTSELDVAIGKLVLEARAEEFHAINGSRLAMESRYPWLTDAQEDIPDDLAQKDPESNREAPYVGIMKRYELLCQRGDRVSESLFSAPAALAGAMSRQADFQIKSGQMVSGASALSMVLEVVGAASLEIPSQNGKDRFVREVARIRKDFIAANPHLGIHSTGG